MTHSKSREHKAKRHCRSITGCYRNKWHKVLCTRNPCL